jgi:hypothetical protein
VRVITQSRAYQLSSDANADNLVDRQCFSRYYPRRLQAEVLLDAIDDLTGTRTTFANLPPGTRAVALPDNSYNTASEFLRVFGRPEGSSVCECERVQTSNLGQSLHLLNSGELRNKLANGSGRAARLATATTPVEDRVKELYLVAFSREPTASELQSAVSYLSDPVLDDAGNPVEPQPSPETNWQDLVWALLNTKEFLFNH